jgi:hypothetical protein
MLCGIVIVLLLSHGGDFELNCSTPRQREGGRDAQQLRSFRHRPLSRRCGDSLPNQGDEFVHSSLMLAITFTTASANVRVTIAMFACGAVVALSSHLFFSSRWWRVLIFELLTGRTIDVRPSASQNCLFNVVTRGLGWKISSA